MLKIVNVAFTYGMVNPSLQFKRDICEPFDGISKALQLASGVKFF